MLGTVPCSSKRSVDQLVLAVHVGVLVALLADVGVVVAVGVEEVLMRTLAGQVRKVFDGTYVANDLRLFFLSATWIEWYK